MDKFLKSKAGRNITALQRHSEFKMWTHESNGHLFCTPCNKIIEHAIKSSVDAHFTTKGHRQAVKRAAEAIANGQPPKKQRTIGPVGSGASASPNTVPAKEKNAICKEVVSMFAAANIPLSKVDHPAVRNFLLNRVMNGGAVPRSKQLQECYLTWSRLEDLKFKFDYCSYREASRHFSDGLLQSQRMELHDLFCQGFSLLSDKLAKYMTVDGQPGINIIKDIRFFDPTKLIFYNLDNLELNLPGINDVPECELKRYMKDLGPSAVKESGATLINLTVIWNSIAADVPNLARLARRNIYLCLSSADAERSFSLYNLVFSERRHKLNEENLQALLFLNYNNFISEYCLM